MKVISEEKVAVISGGWNWKASGACAAMGMAEGATGGPAGIIAGGVLGGLFGGLA